MKYQVIRIDRYNLEHSDVDVVESEDSLEELAVKVFAEWLHEDGPTEEELQHVEKELYNVCTVEENQIVWDGEEEGWIVKKIKKIVAR